MQGLSARQAAIRFVGIIFVLATLIALAGCAPTSFPEPLTSPDCWVLEATVETTFPSSEVPSSYWEWDGLSETAVYHSYGCEPAIGICEYNTYTYRRVCSLEVESTPIPALPSPTPIPCCDVNDGSMNAMHCGRPVAMYPGSLNIWGIDPWTGEGQIAFEVTDEQIAAAGIPAEEPVLIAEGINPYTEAAILIFRLPTGEFQLNTWYVGGKPYVVKWSEGESSITTLEW